MNALPTWPAKLTREQRKAAKQRAKDFDAVLKTGARAAGWRFADGGVFRQSRDWFVSILPSLLWERGVVIRMMVKPMALDPLFWNIVDLSENEALPLSFRASGAWVLRPPSIEDCVALHTTEIELLAAKVLEWGNHRSEDVLKSISVDTMLAALLSDRHICGQRRALAICLYILKGDLDSADCLCGAVEPHAHPLMREGGGFTTHHGDGSISTFCDQARDWIARENRGDLQRRPRPC